MQRRLSAYILLTALALVSLGASNAFAAAAAGSGFDLSWASLDPGDDWAAKMIRSVFPIDPTPGAGTPTSPSIGAEATVIGTIVGQITGFVMAIAMFYVCYLSIINIHRVAESSQILTNSMTSLGLVRIGSAAIMMFPLGTGFSTGQAAVVQASMWGIGMAKAVYTSAIKAIGPDAMVIAQPQIPGTGTIVLNLIQDELCRALVNAATDTASATPQMVPAPIPIQVPDVNGGGVVTWSYSLAPGHATGAPACGSVTVHLPNQGATSIAGVSADMAGQQRTILENVLTSTIRPQVAAIATEFWTSKKTSALNPLSALYASATASYTQQLTQAATTITNSLRNALQDPSNARLGILGLTNDTNNNLDQMSALGWTGAGSYYLEIARLNGQTMSLLSATPVVNMPSYAGFSRSLASDLAPLFTSETAFLANLNTYVATTDGLTTPGGNADMFSGATPGGSGASTIEQLFRSMNFTETLLHTISNAISPTANQWTDPFGGLIQLGQVLILAALNAAGFAAIASSDTATAAKTVWDVLTGHWGVAAATTVAHQVVGFLAPFIFTIVLALLIPGLTIAYVLPMIPWVMWMGGIAGYLILVCEAVVAVPLWMLAHMTFHGEGLHGRATQGYELLFNVLFRPVLMLLGLFLGYFIFASMSWLIRLSFAVAAGFVLQNGSLVPNIIGMFVLLAIFVMTHVVTAILSFRMISIIPHHLPNLIGFSSGNRVDMHEFGRDAATIGAAGALTTIRGGLGSSLPGQTRNNLLGSPQRRLTGPSASASKAAGASEMDSTLRSATDTSHGSAPETKV